MAPTEHGYPIVLSDLTLEYPAKGPSPAYVALHGLSLTIAPGEVVGLLGSAGSGKSTLAKVLSGVAFDPKAGDSRPVITGGEASVLGHRLRSLPKRRVPELRFHVGYLAQDAGSWKTKPMRLRNGRNSRSRMPFISAPSTLSEPPVTLVRPAIARPIGASPS